MTSKDIPSKASDLGGEAYHGQAGPGETDLDKLLQTLEPVLDPIPYVWVSLPPGETPPPTLSSSIIFQFSEPYFPGSKHINPTPSAGLTAMSDSAPKTRTTIVLPKPALNAFSSTTIRLGIDDETLGLPKGTETAFPCRMITCRVQSSLSAVGMMAKITEELASEGVSVNPVSAFYHDYLFVKEEDADLAMDVLLDIVDEAREKAGLPPLDDGEVGNDLGDDQDEDGEAEDEDDQEIEQRTGYKKGETEAVRQQLKRTTVEDEEEED